MRHHQQFILLRGHQGSGKSHFARELIASFSQQFPHGQIVWLENDQHMTDRNGVYHFSPEQLERAILENERRFQSALRAAQNNPKQPMLILNSNTNQKAKMVEDFCQQAKKAGLVCTVYRLHNFFDNQHNVPEEAVLAAYLRLNQQPIDGQIDVVAVRPISAQQSALLRQIEQFDTQNLPFDERQQTFVTPEYLRFKTVNFTRKRTKRFAGLSVLKYKREVFYQNRFDNALLEMRGLVMDDFGNIIVRPFKKVFNYSERIAKGSLYPLSLRDEDWVDAVVKVNGFLGVCTYVALPPKHPSHDADFNQQIIYSTTGSLDSDFARMTEAHCQPYAPLFRAYPNHTFLFEINDECDIHIIREPFGATLIGVVEVATGRQWLESELDAITKRFAHLNLKRPKVLRGIRFSELKALLQTVEHEGFMVFDHHSQAMLCKLKSPYYLISKLLGRSTANNLSRKLDKRHLDEEFYPLIDHIRAHQSAFNALNERDKIEFIQNFLRQND